MRVLHVSSGNLFGGVETLLVTLARLRSACPELEPEFALCFEARVADELRATGVPVHPLGPVRLRRPDSVLRARGALRRLLARERFDAVICHSSWPLAVFGPAVRRSRVPLVMWLHDRADPRHWLGRLARRTAPDLVVCNSEFTAATAPSLFAGVPARVVYCPVAPPPEVDVEAVRRAVRRELTTPEDHVVFVQASRMEEWKGQKLLLRGLAELRALPGWTAWIAGGAQRPEEVAFVAELHRLADDLGLGGRVRFLGQRADVPRLLAAADVHCQPNLGPEPFGIAFVEALYAGLPSVTTRIGGALEIVNADCGVLVPPGDAVALGAALRELAGDPERRARMAAAGRQRAQALCDPARQLHRLRDVLASLRPPTGGQAGS